MEQNCDDVRQFYREKGQEKPVVLNRCGLEKFLKRYKMLTL